MGKIFIRSPSNSELELKTLFRMISCTKWSSSVLFCQVVATVNVYVFVLIKIIALEILHHTHTQFFFNKFSCEDVIHVIILERKIDATKWDFNRISSISFETRATQTTQCHSNDDLLAHGVSYMKKKKKKTKKTYTENVRWVPNENLIELIVRANGITMYERHKYIYIELYVLKNGLNVKGLMPKPNR